MRQNDTNDARRAEATALNTMAGFNGIGCGYQAGVGLAAPISIPLARSGATGKAFGANKTPCR
jgi:hypothetical protein